MSQEELGERQGVPVALKEFIIYSCSTGWGLGLENCGALF